MAEDTNKPLLTLLEFNKYFSIPFKNGDKTEPWPRKTILLFRYRTEQSGVSKWHRQDNTPESPESPGIARMHAKLKMIDILKKQIYDSSIDMIEVFQNYSPCSECSEKLCSLKRELDEKFKQRRNRERQKRVIESLISNTEDLNMNPEDKEEDPKDKVEDPEDKVEDKIEFKITFSYFYLAYGKNLEGIKNLFNSGIKLEILTYDKWQYFFEQTKLVDERKVREFAVKELLDYLENQAKREKA